MVNLWSRGNCGEIVGGDMRSAKRIIFTTIAFMIVGILVTIIGEYVPPNGGIGMVKGLIAMTFVFGAWKFSTRFH